MARKMKSVTPRKEETMTIALSAESLQKADAAARRKVRIAVGQRQSGAGLHGGSDRQNNRRDRRRANQDLRRSKDNGGRDYD